MPACNKILGLYHSKGADFRAMQPKCVDSDGHDGECEFHVWSDGENKATGKEGIMQVIHATKI